ncbi:MAG: hypothetical protein HQL76_15260 [Magnetococcales bacterium]|nr:hypothetical protein [Magnetococcales bacterium]
MGTVILSIVLFAAVFLLVSLDLVNRGAAMVIGATGFLLLGQALDFYSPAQALEAIYFDSLSLLFGMSLISSVLFRSGIFNDLSTRTARFSGGNPTLVFTLLILTTYTLSLFFSNLSVMIIMVPFTLAFCRSMGMAAAPMVAGELVASNLGGASTLVGDFPNMIIGAAAQLHFDDFIRSMMVPNLFFLAILLVFFQHRVNPRNHKSSRSWNQNEPAGISTTQPVDGYLLRLGSWVLALTLIGFLLAQPLGFRPSSVTFVAGLSVLVLGRIPQHELFEAMSGGDLLFFLGLFVMVGGLQAAGILEGFHQLVVTLGGGSATVSFLVLMWLASLVTPFLNAGPTTAFLVPVAKSLSLTFSDHAVWWALSLGVLAGSSASLSGATAGPVVASMMAGRMRGSDTHSDGFILDFRRYLRLGLPVSGIFLLLSSCYIIMITF